MPGANADGRLAAEARGAREPAARALLQQPRLGDRAARGGRDAHGELGVELGPGDALAGGGPAEVRPREGGAEQVLDAGHVDDGAAAVVGDLDALAADRRERALRVERDD